MKINQIILTNYKIYQGRNILDLSSDDDKNINIVSGDNGYGKTSLLNSLVWCLYGKLMGNVDDKYKKDINEAGGYKRYASQSLNRKIKNEFGQLREELLKEYNISAGQNKKKIKERLDEVNSYSVSIFFTDVFIPSLQCDELIITRTYDAINNNERVEILIDKKDNELTKEVGSDIFINDFILPKEIAKFFFFDAEKIVSLAEIKTTQDKLILSKAYSEVLGIKKYEDLKSNLQNLRIRLHKRSASKTDLKKYEKLNRKKEEDQKLLQLYNEKIEKIESGLLSKKRDSDEYQEKLIRQGSSISLDELKGLKERKNALSIEGKKLNQEMRDMMELAPFVIASNSLDRLKTQIELEEEHKTKEVSAKFLSKKTKAIESAITDRHKELKLSPESITKLIALIKGEFEMKEEDTSFVPILNFNKEQVASFYTLYNTVTGSYSE